MALTNAQLEKIEQYVSMYDSTLLSNEYYEFAVQDSADSLSESCFGTQYEKAIAFLTMHTLTVASQTSDGGDATSGAVIQKTIGPITLKWANPSDTSHTKYFDEFKTTKYGRMLIDLIRTSTLGLGISVTDAWRLL